MSKCFLWLFVHVKPSCEAIQKVSMLTDIFLNGWFWNFSGEG